MARVSVLIWCDLGPGLGAGHLMRCIALAEELVSRGRAVHFLTDAASVPFARAQLERREMTWEQPPPDLAGQLAAVARHRPGTVVVDSYVLPVAAYDALGTSYRVAAFVDAGARGRPADVVIDPTLGAEADAAVGPDRLLGIAHALIRDEVLAHRPSDVETHVEGDPPRVVVFSGGTDAHGAAPPLAGAVLGAGLPVHLTVVAARPELRAQLDALVPGPGQGIEVIDPTSELPALIARSDLVVSAAGTSSAELLCLGAAAALVQVADNQADTYRRAVEAGLVAPLGTLADLRGDPASARSIVRDLLDGGDVEGGADGSGARRRLRRAAWAVVDGRGRARIADRL